MVPHSGAVVRRELTSGALHLLEDLTSLLTEPISGALAQQRVRKLQKARPTVSEESLWTFLRLAQLHLYP